MPQIHRLFTCRIEGQVALFEAVMCGVEERGAFLGFQLERCGLGGFGRYGDLEFIICPGGAGEQVVQAPKNGGVLFRFIIHFYRDGAGNFGG